MRRTERNGRGKSGKWNYRVKEKKKKKKCAGYRSEKRKGSESSREGRDI